MLEYNELFDFHLTSEIQNCVTAGEYKSIQCDTITERERIDLEENET
jgi:hypothetical protein